jgi:hypothetical protein
VAAPTNSGYPCWTAGIKSLTSQSQVRQTARKKKARIRRETPPTCHNRAKMVCISRLGGIVTWDKGPIGQCCCTRTHVNGQRPNHGTGRRRVSRAPTNAKTCVGWRSQLPHASYMLQPSSLRILAAVVSEGRPSSCSYPCPPIVINDSDCPATRIGCQIWTRTHRRLGSVAKGVIVGEGARDPRAVKWAKGAKTAVWWSITTWALSNDTKMAVTV